MGKFGQLCTYRPPIPITPTATSYQHTEQLSAALSKRNVISSGCAKFGQPEHLVLFQILALVHYVDPWPQSSSS